MMTLVVVEAVAIALLGLLVAGLLRTHAEILRRLHDLGAGLDQQSRVDAVQPVELRRDAALTGSGAADVVGTTPDGEAVAIAVGDRRHDTIVAFLSSGCDTCVGFWDAFAQSDSPSLPDGARLVVVTKGPEAESLARVRDLSAPGLTVVMSSTAWGDYNVPVAPYFVWVDGASGKVVGEGAAGTWDRLLDLLGQAAADAKAMARGPNARADASGRDTGPRVDRDLASAGIHPGHPSLYPEPAAGQEGAG
jgi:hypothetical protein